MLQRKELKQLPFLFDLPFALVSFAALAYCCLSLSLSLSLGIVQCLILICILDFIFFTVAALRFPCLGRFLLLSLRHYSQQQQKVNRNVLPFFSALFFGDFPKGYVDFDVECAMFYISLTLPHRIIGSDIANIYYIYT